MNRYTIVLLTFCVSTTTAYAVDDSVIAAGKELNDKHCLSCHGPELYTRKGRMVNSKPSLFTQVQRCETNLKLQWFDEETQSVTEYLNKKWYHFK